LLTIDCGRAQPYLKIIFALAEQPTARKKPGAVPDSPLIKGRVSVQQSVPPITEDDIAQFLLNTPDFFERHAELLAAVQLSSPHSQRAVSLQERQAEMMRDKIRQLELKAAELIRHGRDNVLIAEHLHRWTLGLLRMAAAAELPRAIEQGLRSDFDLPDAALRLWGLGQEWVQAPFCQGVTPDTQALADSLAQPYCGPRRELELLNWLAQPEAVRSLALLPLRAAPGEPSFGLLLLASADAQRFQAGMGIDFLQRIAELAVAALARLRP